MQMIEAFSELRRLPPMGGLITDHTTSHFLCYTMKPREPFYELPEAVTRHCEAGEVLAIVRYCAERGIPLA